MTFCQSVSAVQVVNTPIDDGHSNVNNIMKFV